MNNSDQSVYWTVFDTVLWNIYFYNSNKRVILVNYFSASYSSQIQSAVSKYNAQRTDYLKQTVAANRIEKACVAQMPKISSTLGNTSLYLEPGIDMRRPGKHPDSVTDVRYPDNPLTTIQWLPGKITQLSRIEILAAMIYCIPIPKRNPASLCLK